jgi:NAD(P)-dependent dehydrogenase (short-subunit alcohol dehydrogenase family)
MARPARALGGKRPRVWLVTGAAGGIGAAIVDRALRNGDRVAAVDLRPRPRRLARPSPLLWIRHDVTTDPSPVFAAVDKAFGRLDVLVNAAGAAGSGTVEETSLDTWRRLVEVNLTSAFAFSRLAAPRVRRTKGAIVHLSSTNAFSGGSLLSGPAYAAAKAGLIALTRNMARDLASSGARVNCVAPGPIETDMLKRLALPVIEGLRAQTPLGVIGRADDVAGAVFFLASRDARHITGVTLCVSGGLVMP